MDILYTEVSKLLSENNNLKAEIHQLKKQHEEQTYFLMNDVRRCNNELSQKQEIINSLKTRCSELERDNHILKSNIDLQTTHKQQDKQVILYKQKIEELEMRIGSRNQKANKLEKKLDSLVASIIELVEKYRERR